MKYSYCAPFVWNVIGNFENGKMSGKWYFYLENQENFIYQGTVENGNMVG